MIDWNHAAEAALQDMTALRRAIHAEPELGLHNPRTAEKIMAALAGLPLEYRTGPSTTGIIATLKGPANGRTVLLRGDTDALPMPEETGLEFSSTIPGAMHACGHDAHVAMLAGAARILCERRDSLAGSVMFMFQPGEEGHHGARYMLDDGLIDPLPDAAFALHITPNIQSGVFAGRPGPLLAAADRIETLEAELVRTFNNMMRDAVRIEKLEAALRKYADEEYNGFNACGGHARKALEGKDDQRR
jgi:hippurate hydrolase